MADTQTSYKPTHDVCFVRERKGKKSFWTTIGAAWAHKDGAGLNLDIQFLPLDLATGRIVIRLRDQKQDGEAAE